VSKSGSESKPNMAQYFEPFQHQNFSHHEHMQRMSAHYADIHQTYAMAQQIPLPTAPKTNETKPRLGKDEVDILEREFKKNPKPTTQTKRQFAEDMGVELARINVGL
jgi:Homeodomain